MAFYFSYKKLAHYPTFLGLSTLTFISFFRLTQSMDFDRTYTGVTFAPFVKNRDENGKFPPREGYSGGSVPVMMEVIATKFSRVMTHAMSFNSGPPNAAYEEKINAEGHTAESAAHYNKKQGSKILTVLQGVWQMYESQMSAEGQLAVEAVRRAHRVYPGTVIGVAHTNTFRKWDLNNMKTSLKLYRMVKEAHPNMRVGNLWKCENLVANLEKVEEPTEKNVIETFITQSDFIICIQENEKTTPLEVIKKGLITVREKLTKINPHLDVMTYTGWLNEQTNSTDDLRKSLLYWEHLNSWAIANKFPIWLSTAIDIPTYWKGWGYGWWKLKDNSKINEIAGYVEQMSEEMYAPFDYMLIVYIVIGIVAVGLFGAVVPRLVIKWTALKLGDVLTVILNFNEGTHANKDMPCYEAFKVPFDKSFAIPTGQIKFDRNDPIHVGRGSVYKAEIWNHSEARALRMYKNNSTVGLQDMLNEVKILIYLGEHSNVVKLCGAMIEDICLKNVWIVLEFCCLGSLSEYLIKERLTSESELCNRIRDLDNQIDAKSDECAVSTRQLVRWSAEIANGMEFIENKLIIHGGLSTSNVLLTANKVTKITGFNVSLHTRECASYIKSGNAPSMWRWLSIESLTQNEFSEKSDVWSFGITLWEIFSLGSVPYADVKFSKQFTENLQSGWRLQQPMYGESELNLVLLNCWNLESGLRPNFTMLKQILEDFLTKREEHCLTTVDVD